MKGSLNQVGGAMKQSWLTCCGTYRGVTGYWQLLVLLAAMGSGKIKSALCV